MIVVAPTPVNTILGQWVNQTYNAMVNYGNRNASSVYTAADIGKSYTCAVSSSIIVALAIRKLVAIKFGHVGGAKQILLNSVSAFFAVSTAGFLNAYLMR